MRKEDVVYVVSWNMPGYLPTAEPVVVEGREGAVEAVREVLAHVLEVREDPDQLAHDVDVMLAKYNEAIIHATTPEGHTYAVSVEVVDDR